MNILILHNKVPFPPKDGGAIAVWNSALEMARQNHHVTLLCMNTPKHYIPKNQIPPSIHPNLNIIPIDVDTTIKPFSLFLNYIFSSKPYHQVRFRSSAFQQKIKELFQQQTFDIVIYEGLFVLPYIRCIKKIAQTFHVFRAHNIESEIWQRIALNETNPLKKIYIKSLSNRIYKLEKSIINEVDLLLTLTKRDEEQFILLGYKKLHYVSQAGIDLSDIQVNRFSINHPSLFFIGALDWLPNQEGLLWFLRHIWNNIHRQFPSLQFEIAGRNAPYWLIRKLQEYPNIIFYGEIENSHNFMKERAIMVVPLFSGSGMRIKIIEGMALGKSIVTTSIGTEGINTTHNKNILIADTAENFQAEIIKLIENKDFFDKIGIFAQQFIQQEYNIEHIIRNTIQYIEKAMTL